MHKSIHIRNFIVGLCAIAICSSASLAATARHKTSARLFGPTALKGKATYEEKDRSGQRFRRFKVEVERGVPSSVFEVRVNGEIVGDLRINSLGRGKFDMRPAVFIHSPGDGEPMPAGFPKLDTGDIVQVGPIIGICFDQRETSVQRFELRGREDQGNDTVQATVKYRERFKNGRLERRFDVEVEDADDNEEFDIIVNGRNVGTLTTNSFGRGELQLRTPVFIDSPGDGSPMPNSFPSLQEGEVVQVGDLSVSLELRGSGGGGGGNSGSGGGGGDDDDDGDDHGGGGHGGDD